MDVVEGVRRVLPGCEIDHIARWRSGKLRNADDEDILNAASEEGLLFVTYDVSTIPDTIAALTETGHSIAGAAFISASTIQGNDVGGIVRALTDLYARFHRLDPSSPIVWLERRASG